MNSKFYSHVKFFLLVVSFQAASASCYHLKQAENFFIYDFKSDAFIYYLF